jgi:hypothetical protein
MAGELDTRASVMIVAWNGSNCSELVARSVSEREVVVFGDRTMVLKVQGSGVKYLASTCDSNR